MEVKELMEIMGSGRTVYLISFFIVCVLSQFPGNLLVYWLHTQFIRIRRHRPFGKKRVSTQEIIGRHPEHDTMGAMVIGCAERPLYIFAIMFAQPGVITAVIILKAFFNWTQVLTETPPAPASAAENKSPKSLAAERHERMRKTIAHYHAYVIGNLISLALGLALAELGVHAFPPLLRGWCH